MTSHAPIMQGYFTERLTDRRASEHTIAAYRDTFRLLLHYARAELGRPPAALDLIDIDVHFVSGFLDHLETDRNNSIATSNARLAAIHSLFGYAALRCPEHALLIQRVLAIPHKRRESTDVCFLTRAETDALLAVPDQSTPLGRRDHLLLLVAMQTGLRVSELTSLTCADAELAVGAHLRCTGKGRKQRATPLTRPTARLLQRWITDRHAAPADPLFPNRIGGRLSRDAVADLLAKYVPVAARTCPTLASKKAPRTPCATPRRWRCCTPASTPPPSRSGSATPAPRRPTSTCTPTWPPRKRPWPAPHLPASAPSATAPATASSPSWRTCSYHRQPHCQTTTGQP